MVGGLLTVVLPPGLVVLPLGVPLPFGEPEFDPLGVGSGAGRAGFRLLAGVGGANGGGVRGALGVGPTSQHGLCCTGTCGATGGQPSPGMWFWPHSQETGGLLVGGGGGVVGVGGRY